MQNEFKSVRRVRMTVITVGLAGILMGGAAWAFAGSGCGHDSRLDDANAHLVKAFALMLASDNPGVTPPFGGHDTNAERAILRAESEIAKAIQFAESSCDQEIDN